MGEHFYCTDPRGELAPQLGYEREGITGYIFGAASPGTVPLFRWMGNGDHFYTTDPNGELAPQLGYVFEGTTGFIFSSQVIATVPLFRWVQSGIMQNFTFDPAISAQQRATLLERHSWAMFRGRNGAAISSAEQNRLLGAYQKPIHHGISTDPSANASATLGGSNLDVNFGNLFPLGDDEIAQTLIHEMMHSAGFSHPTRRDSPDPAADTPGDNGPYYGSPPLRAELCIAGMQSAKSRVTLQRLRQSPQRADAHWRA